MHERQLTRAPALYTGSSEPDSSGSIPADSAVPRAMLTRPTEGRAVSGTATARLTSTSHRMNRPGPPDLQGSAPPQAGLSSHIQQGPRYPKYAPVSRAPTPHSSSGAATPAVSDTSDAIQRPALANSSYLAPLHPPGPSSQLDSLPSRPVISPMPEAYRPGSPHSRASSVSSVYPDSTSLQSFAHRSLASNQPSHGYSSPGTPFGLSRPTTAMSTADDIQALKLSITQGGGFYMPSPNSDLNGTGSVPHESLRELRQEEERPFPEHDRGPADEPAYYPFSMSSGSSSSSLSSQWANVSSAPMLPEDSGYSNGLPSASQRPWVLKTDDPHEGAGDNHLWASAKRMQPSASASRNSRAGSTSSVSFDLGLYYDDDEKSGNQSAAHDTSADNLTPRLVSPSDLAWPSSRSTPSLARMPAVQHEAGEYLRGESPGTLYRRFPSEAGARHAAPHNGPVRRLISRSQSSSASLQERIRSPLSDAHDIRMETLLNAVNELAGEVNCLLRLQAKLQLRLDRQESESSRHHGALGKLYDRVAFLERHLGVSGHHCAPAHSSSLTSSVSSSSPTHRFVPTPSAEGLARHSQSGCPAHVMSAFDHNGLPHRRHYTTHDIQQNASLDDRRLRSSGPADYPVQSFSNTPQYAPANSSGSSGPTKSHPLQDLATASGIVLSDRDSVRSDTLSVSAEDTTNYVGFIKQILDNNDQQASIFLQQKLKNCSDPHRRSQIIDQILPAAFHLMTNRFGNFLVSRCLDMGHDSQKQAVLNFIKGNVCKLSCDVYGSHVVQKALDEAPAFAEVVVEELAADASTLTNKSAGHVWSKILASGQPPSNLYGAFAGVQDWPSIAMDETGSLLCQAILENWPDKEKDSIVQALIRDTVKLCSSQWATFVVLHLVEHGRDDIRAEVFKVLLSASVTISQDQFGAKAIEKMIKTSGMGSETVKTYVNQICDASQGRPAVVSICQTANGSQIVTLLLTNAPVELKEVLIEAIRRHGVTLKGSKHGSRIWFVVERARAWRGH